mmetsp:Transcript_19349/g.34939  ORF Transcript_19349/g.34939 Transcript_19349/m.34939 type:complete len:157 (-) Transcript_19349:493-963(-)
MVSGFDIPSRTAIAKIHNLPIKILEDESFNLESSIQRNCDQLEVSIRGRLLKGEEFPLPPQVRGCVLKDINAEEYVAKDKNWLLNAYSQERTWSTEGVFETLTAWAHDDVPHKSIHWIPRVLQWPAMAKQAHSQVSMEELDKQLKILSNTTHIVSP